MSVPQDELEHHVFLDSAVARWQSWYGIDFAPLVGQQGHGPGRVLFYARHWQPRDWPALTPPVRLAELDLGNLAGLRVDHEEVVEASASGTITGLVGYFSLHLSSSETLSGHPADVDRQSSWLSPVWIVDPPLQVGPGDRLAVRYQHRMRGGFTTLNVSRVGQRLTRSPDGRGQVG